jgi:two-component system sensor histidine kinase UhpB
VYRIVQEALHNVVKHSGASRAAVSLAHRRGDVVLRIADRGVGFDRRTLPLDDSLGLISMQERARLIQGSLRVSSKPGGGTLVELRVPVRQSIGGPVACMKSPT